MVAGEDKCLITMQQRSLQVRNTGNVMTTDCVKKLIRKNMLCSFARAKLEGSDIQGRGGGGRGVLILQILESN